MIEGLTPGAKVPGAFSSCSHLPYKLYVKHGKTTDTYYTIICNKYVGLGTQRQVAHARLIELLDGSLISGTIAALAAGGLQIKELRGVLD
jgi:hypothetical protein